MGIPRLLMGTAVYALNLYDTFREPQRIIKDTAAPPNAHCQLLWFGASAKGIEALFELVAKCNVATASA